MSFIRSLFGQSAFNIGSNNQNLQIVHNGTAHELPREAVVFNETPQNDGAAAQLEWRRRLADFSGREAEMASLKAWLESPHDLSFRIVHGEGGVGKTRLAAELATEVIGTKKWQSAWVRLSGIQPNSQLQASGQWLLLVDYPEHQAAALQYLAHALKPSPNATAQPSKLRVLLLARRADAVREPLNAAGMASWLAPDAPLQPAAATAQWKTFDSALRRAWPQVPASAQWQTSFEQWVTQQPLHQSALFATALAIDIATEERPATGAGWLHGQDLLAALLARERKRWHEGVPKDRQAKIETTLFWATLLGNLSAAQVNDVLAPALDWQASDRQALLAALSSIRASDGLHIQSVQPDLLASVWLYEYLVVPAHAGQHTTSAELLRELVPPRDAPSFMARANMLAYDQSVRLQLLERGSWLDTWFAEVICGGVHESLRQCIHTAPAILTGLLKTRSAVARRAQQAAGERGVGSGQELAERARTLHNAAIGLAASGDHPAALGAARDAVGTLRRLAALDPFVYEFDLATSLINLVGYLSESGDRPAALLAAREAVDMCRRVTASDPAAYEPNLATSLNQLSTALSQSGEHDAALLAALESVEIRRRLVSIQTAAYEPDLAMSLTSLANCLSESGDRHASLVAAHESVGIRRRLAVANAAAYEPSLGTSLHNLASFLSGSGDHTAALVAGREAVDIGRRLAASNPAAYEPNLAGSLNNLANFLTETGNRPAALVAAREAVNIRRRLADSNAAAYEPDLAMGLGSYMLVLVRAEDLPGALVAGEECLALFTRLAKDEPAAFEGKRAQTEGIVQWLRAALRGDGAAG